jgi:hypothetical protein
LCLVHTLTHTRTYWHTHIRLLDWCAWSFVLGAQTYACTHTHTHAYLNTHAHARIHIRMQYACKHTCAHAYLNTHARAHVYVYIYTRPIPAAERSLCSL